MNITKLRIASMPNQMVAIRVNIFLNFNAPKRPRELQTIPTTKANIKNPNFSNPGLSICGAKLIKPSPASAREAMLTTRQAVLVSQQTPLLRANKTNSCLES